MKSEGVPEVAPSADPARASKARPIQPGPAFGSAPGRAVYQIAMLSKWERLGLG